MTDSFRLRARLRLLKRRIYMSFYDADRQRLVYEIMGTLPNTERWDKPSWYHRHLLQRRDGRGNRYRLLKPFR